MVAKKLSYVHTLDRINRLMHEERTSVLFDYFSSEPEFMRAKEDLTEVRDFFAEVEIESESWIVTVKEHPLIGETVAYELFKEHGTITTTETKELLDALKQGRLMTITRKVICSISEKEVF